MEKNTIAIGTVTYALKARDLLRNLGYRAYVERISENIGKYGCGYSVIAYGDTDKITRALTANGIRILNIL